MTPRATNVSNTLLSKAISITYLQSIQLKDLYRNFVPSHRYLTVLLKPETESTNIEHEVNHRARDSNGTTQRTQLEISKTIEVGQNEIYIGQSDATSP